MKMNRRDFSKLVSRSIVTVPIAGLVASMPSHAGEAPMVDPESATAKALMYMAESDKADVMCSNCALYTGAADAEKGACTIFPGSMVPGKAWCSAYSPKPA